jgi:hypothetical protein
MENLAAGVFRLTVQPKALHPFLLNRSRSQMDKSTHSRR